MQDLFFPLLIISGIISFLIAITRLLLRKVPEARSKMIFDSAVLFAAFSLVSIVLISTYTFLACGGEKECGLVYVGMAGFIIIYTPFFLAGSFVLSLLTKITNYSRVFKISVLCLCIILGLSASYFVSKEAIRNFNFKFENKH